MLEMSTKWFTNTLAKKAIQTSDFIQTSEGNKLYIVSYGEITQGGKNTYNIALKDANDVLISEENNLYLDAITKIILGTSPKAKANKEGGEKKSAKVSNNICEEYKRLEANLKKAIIAFNDFKQSNNINNLEDARKQQRDAQAKRREDAQTKRRNEEMLLIRINKLRKWAKESKRLDLLQKLNNKLLNM